ncbi:MAG: lamin tail domain-containing protein, partial [bacterium]|nr:lamin tail domain-containing protein [bacterium]
LSVICPVPASLIPIPGISWGYPLSAFAVSPGDVVINEIMWMGTEASSYDEWIELYNTTGQDIDLTNWTLKSVDGTPQIVLASTITANGYCILERTDDLVIQDIPADKIYRGALSDTGESLVLTDSYDIEIDSVPCSSGWFAGAKVPNYSMERINPVESGWLAANWGNNNGLTSNGIDANNTALFATPKAQNSIYYDGMIGEDDPSVGPMADFPVRITEVAFAAATDWVEVYNYGATAVDISGLMLTDLDGIDSRLANAKTMLAPGRYAVVYWDETGVDETDEAGDINSNKVIDLYIADTGLSATDDEVVLMSAPSGGQYIDAVCWSNGFGEFASSEDKDLRLLADHDQWVIAGDTVTKSDCWTDSSKVKSDQSIGRMTVTAADTNAKSDWQIFQLPTPGQDNPTFAPPLVALTFDPPPPFKAGQVKITLQIEASYPIVEVPQAAFKEGPDDFQDIILSGTGKFWQGAFEITQFEEEKNITLRYKVIDQAKNSSEQEIIYLGLAYVPPEYGEQMYCYPNPWTRSSAAILKFSNIGEAESTIKIFTLNGEQVKILTGLGELYWDGTNENGAKVAAGIYIYYMENSQCVKRGKIAILK